MPDRYRHKPNEVFAVQWNGLEDDDSGLSISPYGRKKVDSRYPCKLCGSLMRDHGVAESSRPVKYLICPGDYVITDESGMLAIGRYKESEFMREFESITSPEEK